MNKHPRGVEGAVLILVLACVSPVFSQGPPPVGVGELRSLSISPSPIRLNERNSSRQLVITGHYANGGVADLTHEAAISALDEQVLRVDPGAFLVSLADGQTEIVIEHDGQSVQAEVEVSGTSLERPINFTNEIVPILTKLGCNAGGCHGKAEGQNGFKLSLLGFDPAADYDALVHEGRGRRVLESAPRHSLLLLKPTGQLGHGGGKPLKPDSAEYSLLEKWIRRGVPFGSDDDPRVVSIDVTPAHRLLGTNVRQQLAVTAHYSDGAARDVTRRAEFKSNDPELADVSERGLVETTNRPGEGSVMIRFMGHVALFRATIPREAARIEPAQSLAEHKPANFIDELAFAKHRQLGYEPSQLCTDGEFLRRATLDIIGTLPTAKEVVEFSADQDPKKREKLVDALLQRPEYAAYWSLKWADILRVRGGSNDDTKTKIEGLNTRAVKFRQWIADSLAKNKPYDQFVREIITADGITSGPQTKPPILWYLELKNAEGLVEDTAQAFLGVRIQCARCHHHPFEKWSQEDYWRLAAFFGRVEWQVGFEKNGKRAKEPKPVRASESGRVGQLVAYNPDGQLTDPQGRVYDKPAALGGNPWDIDKDHDPRQRLVAWMVEEENPHFARALVNRYWGHFFGRGIIEPIDDMRQTNPASNPQLLDALGKEFAGSKFDLKQLIRTICTSKTYQLSSRPNATNRQDTKHFSRFLPRRLPAEVLYDAIDQVTNNKTKFRVAGEKTKVELEIRAIERPHLRVRNYFLDTFGINKRDSACECGRESNVTLAQRVLLLNNDGVRAKLTSRAKTLLADERSVEDKVAQCYVEFFARGPNDDELRACVEYINAKAADERKKDEAYYDLLWALVNTKEFVFQH